MAVEQSVLPTTDPLASVRNRLTQPVNTDQPGSSAWRVDPVYDNAVRNIQSGMANLSSDINLQEGRIKSDAQKAAQQLAISRDDTLKALQNKLAAQGIGFSGINVEGQADIGKKYLEGFESLKTGTTRGLEDLARDTLGKVQSYNEQLTGAQIARAEKQTTWEQEQAMAAARAEADKTAADDVRTQLEEIKSVVLNSLQPKPAPTGRMVLPPPPPPPRPPAPPPAFRPPTPQIAPALNNPQALTEAQNLLNGVGAYNLTADGLFGPKTKSALIDFKVKNGLPPDGILDEVTMAMLRQRMSQLNPGPPVGGASAIPNRLGPARPTMVM